MSSIKKRKTSTYKPKTTHQAAPARVAASSNNNSVKNERPAPTEGNEIKTESKTVANAKRNEPVNARSQKGEQTSVSRNAENRANETRDYSAPHVHTAKKMTTKEKWIWAVCTIGITLLVGLVAKLLGGDMKHFESHTLPPATAPVWIYPIAWGILYFLIGLAAFLVFTSPNQTKETRKWDMVWFGINLFLNMIWPLFFYRLDLLILSTILCAFIVITAAITCYRFYYRNFAAGILYTIYVLWLLYAFYINLGICLLNV